MKQLLNHSVTGKGQCVVLLHGLMEDIQIWDDLTKRLSQNFLVVCIDLPGHGKSPVFDTIHTMDFMAECVKDILTELQVEKCVMVGHSMGGYVMIAFARRFLETLCGICFLNSHALPDSDMALQNRERAIELIQNNKQEYIAGFMENLFVNENRNRFQPEIKQLTERANKMTADAIIAAHRGMQKRPAGLSVLTDATCPILFIAGKKDNSITIDKIMAQALLPKHAELLILENVAHIALIEDKQATISTIASFAERCFGYLSTSDCFDFS
jgi:pimeloyl-ACP methyl ester carboxylesterase